MNPKIFHGNILGSALLLTAVAVSARSAESVPAAEVSRCRVKVISIQHYRAFKGTAVLTHFDPLFVATVELLEDCGCLDRKTGGHVSLAIHSVARTFLESMDQVAGHTHTIEVRRLFVDGKAQIRIAPAFAEANENTPSAQRKQEGQ